MGSIAKGKVNASEAEAGMRIIVKVSYDAEGHATIRPSSTKTGEGVFVARIIEKGFRAAGRYEARGKYVIHTSAGSFDAAPIQTMWLAPEDPAGIKRAYAEAVAEDAHRAELAAAAAPAVEAGAAPAAEEFTPAERAELAADFRTSGALDDAHAEALEIESAQSLTLHSQACKVSPNSKDNAPEEIEMAQNLTHTEARNYPLSNGETADLIALVSAVKPSTWVQATEAQPIGTVVYAYAMGELRRGVVVKNTPTKTLVALTTAAASAPGGSVRVQTATELHTTVYVAPAPVVETPAEPVQEAEEGAERFTLTETQVEENAAQSERENLADAEAAREANEAPGGIYGPAGTSQAEELTLHSQDGKVGLNSEDDTEEPEMTAQTETAPATAPEIHTGSTVVILIEKVWDAIRAEHPELPRVVVTTGSGEGVKWGHFRPESWRLGKDGEKLHEFFLASEALAKGALQVLQTTIHEAAHTLSKVRGVQDTSRQNRYHNGTFRKTAEELGLEHKGANPDKTHGFSFVTLTEATKVKYAEILGELERELKLTGLLPFWLGGSDDEDERGGEKITGKPVKGQEGETKSGNLKATCECAEPIIIRLSRKVLDLGVVRCDSCESLFTAA
jgi:hypothetical protein